MDEKIVSGTAISPVLADTFALDPKKLEQQFKNESDRRKLLKKFINSQLVEGVDYGTIKISGRESKPCLFKPGSEKFCSLLQLRAEFIKDAETLSMIPESSSTIAYVCRLIHIPSGESVSEGRGACSLSEKQNMVNTTIKIAEKRAQIDAVLRLGFSDSFTQDLDDMEKPVESKSTALKATQEQKDEIDALATELGITKAEVAKKVRENYSVSITEITKVQADGIIGGLKTRLKKV